MPLERDTWELEHRLEVGRLMHEALPAGLYEAERLEAFVRALGHGVQVLEDRIAERHLSLSLAGASGADLDILGTLVGERRDGLSDGAYRRFIAARLLANKSQGTSDELIKILQLCTGSELLAIYTLSGLAEFHLYFLSATALPAELVDRVSRLLVAVKPAGVTMLLVEVLQPSTGDPSSPVFTTAGLATGLLSRQLYP